MKRIGKAKVRWLPSAEGGRSSPPAGKKYSTVARFSAQSTSWDDDAWSIVLEFLAPPDENLEQLAEVSFLMDNAPDELMANGKEIKLMEGSRCVGVATIVGDCDLNPSQPNEVE